MSTHSNSHNYQNSPFFVGKLPFLMGKSPFLMGKSQFLMGKSPFFVGKSTISMAIEKKSLAIGVNSTNRPLELVRRLWNPPSAAGPAGLQVAVSVKTGHDIGGWLESVERTLFRVPHSHITIYT